MFKKGVLLLLIFLFGMFGGCSQKFAPADHTRKIIDMAGREVSVPQKIEKVFSTSAAGSVFIYTLAPEKLVGWNWDLTPEEKKFISPPYQNMPNLGSWSGKNTANIEEILKIYPDVIISMGYVDATAVSQADQIQAQLGIPVVLVDGELTRLDKAYEFAGELLGARPRARELGAYCRETVNAITSNAKLIPQDRQVRVYYAEGPTGLQTEARGSEHTRVLDLVGGVNVAAIPGERGKGMASVSLEQVLSWNPEVILTWSKTHGGAYDLILTDPKWKSIKAVKTGRVYEVPHGPFNWFDRPPSVNRLLGLKWLASLLYPETFDYNLAAEVKEFYARFYHYRLSDEELSELLARSR